MTADGRFRDRYPGPWTIEEGENCLIVRGLAGEPLVYIHHRDVPAEWRTGPIWRFSPAEASVFARAIAGLAKKKGRKDPAQSGQLDLFDD
jgi:hypothetical protein